MFSKYLKLNCDFALKSLSSVHSKFQVNFEQLGHPVFILLLDGVATGQIMEMEQPRTPRLQVTNRVRLRFDRKFWESEARDGMND